MQELQGASPYFLPWWKSLRTFVRRNYWMSLYLEQEKRAPNVSLPWLGPAFAGRLVPAGQTHLARIPGIGKGPTMPSRFSRRFIHLAFITSVLTCPNIADASGQFVTANFIVQAP